MKYSVMLLLSSVALSAGCLNQGKDIVSNRTLKANMDACKKQEHQQLQYECTFSACNKQTACKNCLNDIYAKELCESKEDFACIWSNFGACKLTDEQIAAEEAAAATTAAPEEEAATAAPAAPMTQAEWAQYKEDAKHCGNIECAIKKCQDWDRCKPCLEKTKKKCQRDYPKTKAEHCWLNHLENCNEN